MGKTGNRTESNVFLVPDDAHIVRYAELRDLLEELGTVGMVARYLNVGTSTVSRHCAAARIALGPEFVGRMGQEIERLQHEHDHDLAEIKELRAKLRRRKDDKAQ